MQKEKVQKVIAGRGVCSRRAAEKLIAEGRVRVNGRKIDLGARCDPQTSEITIDGKKIPPKRKENIYVLLNKPRGYVTTVSDEKGRKTVMELIDGVEERIYPVGRFDMASEGLLFLTNDGELARFLMHPSSGIEKEYRVTVLGDAEKAIPKFEEGVVLDDGFKTSPAKAQIIKEIGEKTVLSITIAEGHNRQVRKMCEVCGFEVRRLVRVAEGQLKLGSLPVGKWRHATPEEAEYLAGLINAKKGNEK